MGISKEQLAEMLLNDAFPLSVKEQADAGRYLGFVRMVGRRGGAI